MFIKTDGIDISEDEVSRETWLCPTLRPWIRIVPHPSLPNCHFTNFRKHHILKKKNDLGHFSWVEVVVQDMVFLFGCKFLYLHLTGLHTLHNLGLEHYKWTSFRQEHHWTVNKHEECGFLPAYQKRAAACLVSPSIMIGSCIRTMNEKKAKLERSMGSV